MHQVEFVGFIVPLDAFLIFSANLWIGAKLPDFSTNHMAERLIDINNTKHNCNQEQHKKLFPTSHNK